MLQTIIEAIRNRQILTFNYHDYRREVEPHAVGATKDGYDVLLCYQTLGGHVTLGHDWDFCELSKIGQLEVTGELFSKARAGYKKIDKGMAIIYAEL